MLEPPDPNNNPPTTHRSRREPPASAEKNLADEEWEAISDWHPLSFLLSQYERRVYWFEVVECCRRLALSGAVILFGPGTPMQLVVSLFLCAVTIKIYSYYEPQRDYDDDILTEISQWQVCVKLKKVY